MGLVVEKGKVFLFAVTLYLICSGDSHFKSLQKTRVNEYFFKSPFKFLV